jgi:hypothetical protein
MTIFYIDTVEALDRWFGKIKGYTRVEANNTGYYQEDMEPSFINGEELVQAVLDQMHPYVIRAYSEPELMTVDVDMRTLLYDYMVGTGARDGDYTEQDLEAEMEDNALGILTGVKREMEIRVDPYQYVHEDFNADQGGEEAPAQRHSHVTHGSQEPRKESVMTQRNRPARRRANADVARAQARTAMKLRMENQRTAAVNRLRRRLAAVRAARAERVAAAQPEAQETRRPSRILRSAAERSVARRDHEVTTKSVARDEVRRRIAAIRQKAAAARLAAGQQDTQPEVKPADRFAALRERLAQRRRIAAIRTALAERRASVEHDAEVAPPVIRVKGVRYERID